MWLELWADEEGQDIVEYTLLLAAVVLLSVAALTGIGSNVSGLWTAANNRLDKASN